MCGPGGAARCSPPPPRGISDHGAADSPLRPHAAFTDRTLAMLGFFGAWLTLVVLAQPVAFALGTVAVGWLLLEGAPMITAPQRLMAGADNFALLAVPFFVLAGNLMNTAGITDRIYGFCAAMVGHW